MSTRTVATALLLLAIVRLAPCHAQQARLLGSIDNLDLMNVKAELVQYRGKDCVYLTGTRQQGAPNVRRAGGAQAGMRPAAGGEAQNRRTGAPGAGGGPRRERVESLGILKGVDFSNGTIELELAGSPAESAGDSARGFIGIAFHVEKSEPVAYDCFYIRPTNGRADDQLRRNHSCQYMSHPDYPWMRLRTEFPGVYESYADLVPGEWTRLKIEVDGEKARLYVNGAEQPSLIINDVKRAGKGGSIALWTEPSTDAYFRNLVVTADK